MQSPKRTSRPAPTRAAIVRNRLKGIRRGLGTAPTQNTAALTDDIRAMVDATDAGIIGDRALILLGSAGAFRRSELVRLDVEDCAFSQGSPDRDATAIEGRSGEGRPEDRYTLRVESRDVPGPHGPGVGRTSGRDGRAAVRSGNRHGLVQSGTLSGIDVARLSKKLATRAGLDAAQIRGPLPSRRTCYQRGHSGRVGAIHHETN
jgi:hypothetical protein